jgi:hypothetical protein
MSGSNSIAPATHQRRGRSNDEPSEREPLHCDSPISSQAAAESAGERRREAFGVRPACWRFGLVCDDAKAGASWTHSKRFAPLGCGSAALRSRLWVLNGATAKPGSILRCWGLMKVNPGRFGRPPSTQRREGRREKTLLTEPLRCASETVVATLKPHNDKSSEREPLRLIAEIMITTRNQWT